MKCSLVPLIFLKWSLVFPILFFSSISLNWLLKKAFLSAEYIMRNAGLEEAQAGIKIAKRNVNNFRYADDSTLMAEREEELKSLLMKVKEEGKKLA